MSMECDPQDAAVSRFGIETIWRAAQALYDTGLHPALSLSIRRRGRIVLNRGLGELRPGVPVTAATPMCLFSSSKAISALLVHKLAETGRLKLDDPVAHYLPEFAAHGKGKVSLRALLAHRAGIPILDAKNADPALLFQWDECVQRLCAAKPFNLRFERQAYHAITAGFIVGEVVRRVSGLTPREALRQWFAQPLKCASLDYGIVPERRPDAPANTLAGRRVPWIVNRLCQRVLGAPLDQCVEISNDPRFLSAVIPSGNIYASAEDAGRVFQMLLNGGELDGVRVLEPETIAEAIRPVGPAQLDAMLMMPVRFSPGFWLGERRGLSLYGAETPQAFGHMGFINIACWADPERALSVALLNTGKALTLTGMHRFLQLTAAISRECPPLAGYRTALAA